jgi:hypothetical protein
LYLGGLFLLIGLASDRLGAKAEPGQPALWTFSAIAAAYLLVSPLRDNTMSFLAGDSIRFSEMVALFIVVFCSVIALWRAPRRSA